MNRILAVLYNHRSMYTTFSYIIGTYGIGIDIFVWIDNYIRQHHFLYLLELDERPISYISTAILSMTIGCILGPLITPLYIPYKIYQENLKE